MVLFDVFSGFSSLRCRLSIVAVFVGTFRGQAMSWVGFPRHCHRRRCRLLTHDGICHGLACRRRAFVCVHDTCCRLVVDFVLVLQMVFRVSMALVGCF